MLTWLSVCVCSDSKQKTGAPEVLCTFRLFQHARTAEFPKQYSTLCAKSCTCKGTAIHITTVFTLKQTCTCGVMPSCFISKRFGPNTGILAHHALDVPHQTFNLQMFKHMTWSKMWCCFFLNYKKSHGDVSFFFPQPYFFRQKSGTQKTTMGNLRMMRDNPRMKTTRWAPNRSLHMELLWGP